MLLTSHQRDVIKWLAGVATTVAGIFVIAEVPTDAILKFSFVEQTPAAESIAPPAQSEKHVDKQQILFGRKPSSGPQGKGSSVVEVQIRANDHAAVISGSTIELEATIEAQSDQQDLKYVWLMPQEGGLTALAGGLEGDLGSLSQGQTATLRISLMSDTSENRRVHLHVYKLVNGEAMGRMTQYNTVDQAKIDAAGQEKDDVLGQGASTHSEQKVIQ